MDLLVPADQPLADPLTQSLARMRVLMGATDAELAPLGLRAERLAQHTEALALATELEALTEELANGLLTPAQVADRLRQRGDQGEADRWEVLALIEARTREALLALGCRSASEARLAEAFHPSPGNTPLNNLHVVLVSTPDLTPLLARLLEQSKVTVMALVGAPRQEAASFTPWGGLLPRAWIQRASPLQTRQIQVVERPRDLGPATLTYLRSLNGTFAASQITLGVCDEALLPVLEQALDQADIPIRPAVGTSLAATSPALLLDALARLLENPSAAELGALLRHPAVEEWLRFQPEAMARGLLLPPGEWITLLDKLWAEHLPPALPGWSAIEPALEGLNLAPSLRPLVHLTRCLQELLPEDPVTPRPLPEQARLLRSLLHSLYGHKSFHRFQLEDRPILYTLEAIGRELSSWERLEAAVAADWLLPVAEALQFLLRRLAHQALPAREAPDSLELLGWLELPLDDAPVLILAGLNEGKVPESRTAHPFLPESLRTWLGLPDNQQRLARDAFMLHQLHHTRPHLRCLVPRRSLAGDPLLPSRLLLAASPEIMAQRLLEFFREDLPQTGPWIVAGNPNLRERRLGFYRLMPKKLEQPISRLSVTAFRSYLTCPYRFYLQHVLRLRTLEDSAQELDGGLFGSLAHDALMVLGEAPLRTAHDPSLLRRALQEKLETRARERFGSQPGAAVQLQLRHLARRLERFAEVQAEQARQGWCIDQVEQALTVTLQVDDLPFVLEGRVDRIDRHDDGRYRILDYKTQDKPRDPEHSHRTKGENGLTWVDLQLPLYRTLAAAAQIPPQQCQVGYISVSADLSADPFLLAPWGEADFQDAHQQLEQLIRALRREVFWPPREAPGATDPFAGLTFDRCLDPNSFGTRAFEELQ